MKLKILIFAILLLLPLFFANPSHASTIESLEVSSLNSTPVISNMVLENGKMYVVEISGTYTFAPGSRIADAEFAYDPDTNLFYEEFNVVNKEYNLDLIVNGSAQDWLGSANGIDFYPHTFSPNHVYRIYVEGQGQPLSFYIYDSSYDWNEGFLTVSISKNLPTEKNECKSLGWKSYSEIFSNQGMCIKSVKNN